VLVAVRVGAGGVSPCAGGAAAIDGKDTVPVTEDSADPDCRVVLRPLPAGTGSGAVVVAPGVPSAPRYGLRGFPPKAVTVTATVITSTTTPVTAAAVRTGRERIPRLSGWRARCRGPGRLPEVTASRAGPVWR
jgi:hypothetical protein